jgi:outer membrane receptor protein involved in Fe transport
MNTALLVLLLTQAVQVATPPVPPVQAAPAPPVVSASVLVLGDAPRRDPATGAQTLSKTFLSSAPALTTDEALRVVAGLSLFRRSSSRTANPTTHGVTMRGLSASGASRGVVDLDGLPLNDGFGAWVTWTRLPAGALDSVEVIPGAAGDLFGSDALGGVIRLRSTTPRSAGPIISAGAGTRETWTSDASGGVTKGRAGLWMAASWVDTAGEIPIEPASRGQVDRPASANWWNAFGRADVTQGSRRWTVTGVGGRDRRGNGTALQYNRNRGGTFSAAVQSVGSHATWAARVGVTPNTLHQTFTSPSSTRATETLTSTQKIDVTTTRLVLEGGRSISRGFVMLRGGATRAAADFDELRGTVRTTVALRDDSESLSAQVGVTPRADLTFGAGVRHEWRVAPASADSRDRALVGRLTAAWRVRSSLTVRATAATSHRWPTLNELVRGFRVGSTSTLPNPALKPERARAIDAGLTISRPRGTFGVAVFSTTVQDAIANVTLPSPGIVRERRNAGEAHARGLEADADVRPWTWLQLRASLSATDAAFRQSQEPALEGNQLPQVPRVSGALAVEVVPVTWGRAGLVVRSVGAQFDDDRNVFRLAAATQVDMRVSAHARQVELAMVVENLFDARVEVGRTPLVTLAPSRAMRVAATWTLGGR